MDVPPGCAAIACMLGQCYWPDSSAPVWGRGGECVATVAGRG